MRRRDGFTLVELLVVMGVIMVLLGILFPVYSSIRRSQKVERTKAAVQAVASGVEAYQNDYGVYPPAEFVSEPVNRGNRSLVTLLNAKGGRSAPYLPSAYYERGEIVGPLLVDEWERPFIYFDTSVMREDISHDYGIAGNRSVSPARGAEGFCNLGRFQLWSCGPNERNDGGRGHRAGADDVANFQVAE